MFEDLENKLLECEMSFVVDSYHMVISLIQCTILCLTQINVIFLDTNSVYFQCFYLYDKYSLF